MEAFCFGNHKHRIDFNNTGRKKKCPAKIVLKKNSDGDYEKISICVTFEGIDYFGIGKEYTLEDAFADLQHNLPPDVSLACCMTCKYGNMCPYGTLPRQIFCKKDLIINNKYDVVDALDNNDGYEKREVLADSYCDNFEYKSEDSYTYNDFLFWLKTKN